MFTYEHDRRFFGQIGQGLEDQGAIELQELGATEVTPAYRGLYFNATTEALYRINYSARMLTRILAPLLRFDCHSTKYLYQTAIKMPWHEMLRKDGSFIISSRAANSKINHSQYAAQCLKDAIADHFKSRFGVRPSIDKDNPDLWLDLHIDKDKATISIDTSGGSLHRRGYRKDTVEAPIQESLGAAIIRLSEWQGERPLVDPMCGSGTLLSEALMHYCRFPAGCLRQRFGFEAMPDFHRTAWLEVKREMDSKSRTLPEGLIRGNDLSANAVRASRTNLGQLDHGSGVIVSKGGYQKLDGIEDSVIVCNPPHGIRLGREQDMGMFMKEFGDFLKQRCTGSSAFLYFGKRDLLKRIGLRPAWKKPLVSGGQEGVLARYDMY